VTLFGTIGVHMHTHTHTHGSREASGGKTYLLPNFLLYLLFLLFVV
jgi:hypothetical protein